ncbi:DUF2790 domain-containing protein [Pseudomonas sp. PDM17]|uniref:DUF2790 domain-containing protein n=1 Tax=Pseudomonas sp. PDM17 TaxID=2769285 RepID=UPI001787194E|nr:DUF2790 domain-containing protein [Pseudomonas sp. PDM17]MBD9504550.1 DUF2790 domain-containing protein [Pseudomonas sp. PDM17]
MKVSWFVIALVVAVSGCSSAMSGVKPDIAKVISISDARNACGVVPVTLVYEDSQGVRKSLEYQVWGGGCSGG